MKNKIKKSVSVFLTLMMLLSCWVWVAPHEHTYAEAAVTEKGKVAFYVPEVIYLAPNAQSWNTSTTSVFQQYVENTPNTGNIYAAPTPSTTATTTGTIYFAASNGFSNPVLSTRFMNADGSTLSGGSIGVSAFSNKTSYGTFSITSGTSPSLAANVTGCYVEWTVTYTNNAGERQSAIAYSYVYKPFVRTLGAAVKSRNNNATDIWAQSIGWISGVHSIGSSGYSGTDDSDIKGYSHSWAPNYLYSSSGRGFNAFISNVNSGYVGATSTSGITAKANSSSTGWVSQVSGQKNYYAVFASTNTSLAMMYAGQSGSTWNNSGAGSWFNNSSNMGASYSWATHEANSDKDHTSTSVYSAYRGEIFIDTSRYTNLGQIPNLGVGLMATDDEASGGYLWYVADATGITTKKNVNFWQANDSDSKALFDGKTAVIAGQFDGKSVYYDKTAAFTGQAEGILYAGNWVKEISSSTTTYTIKTLFTSDNSDPSYASGYTWIDLYTTQQNKSALRTAVNNAINAMGTLGLKDSYGSYYYDTNSAAWKAFKTAYMNACIGLTKLDGAVDDVSGLATALNNAVTALKNGQGRKIYFDVNHDGINPNLYVLGSVTNGGYGLTVTYNSDESITLNGTISGSNAFGTTPFTPIEGSYTFKATLLSGSKTGDGCVVLDASYDNGGNISTRTNFDFTSTATKVNTFNSTTAPQTDLLRFWQWKNTQNDVYSNLRFRIKVEKGSVATAYSPAAKVSSNGYYILPSYQPTRVGYTFGGWAVSRDSKTAVSTSTAISSDTLYAIWNANSYTIYFDGNGHTGGATSQLSMTYDTAKNLTANGYTKNGYTFTGWNTAANGSGTSYADKASVKNLRTNNGDSITLYAQWTINYYTVKFVNDAGQTVSEKTYPYGTNAADIEVPANTAPAAYESTEYHHKFTWQTRQNVTGNATYYEVKSDEAHNIKTSVTPPTCTGQGYTTYSCDICNGSYDADYVAANGHNYIAKVTTEATCVTPGVKTNTCSVCGDSYTEEITANGHTLTQVEAKAPTCTEKGHEAYEYCSVCDYTTYKEVAAKGHTEEVIPAVAPTCEDTGLTEGKKCSVCGTITVAQKEVAAKGHDYEAKVTTEPTCEGTGVRTYTCKNDASHTYTEEIEAEGHSYGEWIDVAPATCVATGTKGHYECSVCHKNFDAEKKELSDLVIEIDPSNHTNLTKTDAVEAKCEKDGNIDYWTCDGCKKLYSDENAATEITAEETVIEQLGHSFTDYVSNNDATCTEDGTKTAKCDRCDATDTKADEDSKLGHEWSDTYTSNGDGKDNTHYQTCTRENCGVKNEAVAHTWNEGVVTTNPGCTTDGVKTFTCTADGCGATYTEAVVQNGHKEAAAVEENRTEATCTTDGYYESVVYCSVCNAEISRTPVTIKAEGHKFSDITAAKEATCVATGNEAYKSCTVCNKFFAAAAEANSTDAKESKDVFTIDIDSNNHVTTTDHEQTDATCLAVGYTAGTFCEDCDKWISGHEEIPAIGHKNKVHHEKEAATCVATGTIEYWACPDCGKNFSDEACTTEVTDLTIAIDPDNHDLKTTAAKAPTCTEIGWDEYVTCQRDGCNYTTYVEKAANGHSLGEYIIDKEATCTETGSKHKECTICDYKTEAEEIPALGHNMVDDLGYAATCTEDGLTDGKHCTRCEDATEAQVVIPALGHNMVDDLGYAATCTTTGMTDGKHCTRCDAMTEEQEVIPALGHDMVDDLGYAATCTEDGLTDGKHCTRCEDATETQVVIPALGHNMVDDLGYAATCTEDGLTDGKHCTRCEDATEAQVVIPALGHNMVDDLGYAATCTTTGMTDGKHCTRCDAMTEEQEVIPELGHNMVDDLGYAATCTEDGLTDGKHCTRCEDATETQVVIPALGHDFGEWVLTTAPTADADGEYTRYCSKNDATETKAVKLADYSDLEKVIEDLEELLKNDELTEEAKAAINAAIEKAEAVEDNLPADVIEDGEVIIEGEQDAIDSVVTELDKVVDDINNGINDGTMTKADTTELNSVLEALKNAVDTDAIPAGVADELIAEVEELLETIKNDSTPTKNEYQADIDSAKNEISDILTKYEGCIAGTHTEEIIPAVGSTCEGTGLTEGKKCSVCGDILVAQTETAAHGHNYVGVITKDSTCTELGVKTYTCTHDATHTYTEDIAVKAHSLVYVDYKAPACEATGHEAYEYCTECTYTSFVSISSTGHDYDDGVITKDPTCEGKGEKTFTCKNDASHTYTEEVAATGHDMVAGNVVAPTCTKDGYTVYNCANGCGRTENRDIVPATGHDFDKTQSEANLTRPYKSNGAWVDGYYTYTCKNDASHTTKETVKRADYSEYDKLTETAEKIIELGISAEDMEKLQTVLKNNEIPENLITSEQAQVDAVLGAIRNVISEVYPDAGLTLVIEGAKSHYVGKVLDLKAFKVNEFVNIEATNVTWESSDETKVFVSNGRLFAIGTGTVTITAKTGILEASTTITIVEGGDARGIKFTAIDKMHFIVEDYFAVYNGATLYWSDADVIRFRVHIYQTFPFETYIVYVNGEAVEPDADGYYTVPANAGDVRITVSGALYEEDSNGTTSKFNFWEWLLALLRKICNFFKNLFGIA